MPPCSAFDALIDSLRYDGAKRLRVRGVTESPNVFNFFLWQLESLGNVNVGGKCLDAWWI